MTTTTEASPAKNAVWTENGGEFRRNGELIATVNTDAEPVFTPEGERYRHVVLKRLKEKARAAISQPRPQSEVGTPPPPAPPVAAAPIPADPWATLNPQQREAIIWLRKRCNFDPFHVERRTKKPVKLDKFIGDKSVAYVMDLLRYEPLTFVDNYGLQRLGKIVRMERVMDKERGLKVKKRVETVVAVSVRKTHLTERADNMNLVEEVDDNE